MAKALALQVIEAFAVAARQNLFTTVLIKPSPYNFGNLRMVNQAERHAQP